MSEPLVAALEAPGWYGKIPALGDFASRRLPATFIRCWDAWLQRELEQGMRALGAAWREKYLNAPIWRFALSPGICGPQAWTGVWMPSIDRTGRHFPLTVARSLPADGGPQLPLAAAGRWYEAVERAMLGALDLQTTVDRLEHDLLRAARDAGRDDDATWPGAPAAGATSPSWRALCPTPRRPHGEEALLNGAGTCTLWWTTATNDTDPLLRIYPDLPQGTGFRQLLDVAQSP